MWNFFSNNCVSDLIDVKFFRPDFFSILHAQNFFFLRMLIIFVMPVNASFLNIGKWAFLVTFDLAAIKTQPRVRAALALPFIDMNVFG